MKSTRQRIVDILNNREHGTAAELSRALQVTQADVRYHLSRMIQEGLIVSSSPRRLGRRGRPARRFSLTSMVNKDNFDLLSIALLTTFLELNGNNNFLNQVANHIAGDFQPAGPLGQRLVQAVGQLNELNYQARWEAHADAPRIIFEHCPFAALRPQHPELCQLDANLLAIFLDESITPVESNAHLTDGYCLFLIG